MAPLVLVIGRQFGEPPPGLPETTNAVRYVFADDLEGVREYIAEAEIVFHYGGPRTALRDVWAETSRLRWIHVGNIGVDWALFPELIESDVVVTNSRGVFDVSMPEYALALMLALLKDLPGSIRLQQQQRWQHRALEPLAGGHVVMLGAGSIARSTGRVLRAMAMSVTIVGTTERDGGVDEGRIRSVADLHDLLPAADWLICATPLTRATHGLIGAAELAQLPRGARVVNIGRGPVDLGSRAARSAPLGRARRGSTGCLRDRATASGAPFLVDAQRHRLTAHRR